MTPKEHQKLNSAVARALNLDFYILDEVVFLQAHHTEACNVQRIWAPSRWWSQAGWIIDRFDIAIGHEQHAESDDHRFCARINGESPTLGEGPTKLIAAMRCLLAYKGIEE